jgi:hypothetical protein
MQVTFSGEEPPFAIPSQEEVEQYLEAAAEAFFGSLPPTGSSLTFDPAGARAAIDTQRGGGASGPQKKEDLIAALAALPEFSGKKTKLTKMKVDELKKLWQEKQAAAAEPEGLGGAGSDSSPRES